MESNNHRLMIRVDQVQPSVESLEEMTVHTSNFAAEYGQVAGGIFNLTAKSGTNTMRGSLFEYYVHEKFGAGIPFTNDGSRKARQTAEPPQQLRRQPGRPVTIPGVYNGRNRTFFFYSFEQFRQIETRSGLLQTMPTDRMRNGDFGEALTGRVLATDPLGPSDHGERDLRSANDACRQRTGRSRSVPEQRHSAGAPRPGSPEDSGDIPRATRAGLINNWDQSFPADTIKSISTMKVDHNFVGIGGKLSGYYSHYWGPHYNGSDGLPIPITRVRRLRDVDPHDSRQLRLDDDADDAAECAGRVSAALQPGFRTARGARIRSRR